MRYVYESRNIAMRLDLDKAPSQPLPSMFGRGSEKLEKHLTFKSTNRNSIVTVVSNEAPFIMAFGMTLFDLVLAKI